MKFFLVANMIFGLLSCKLSQPIDGYFKLTNPSDTSYYAELEFKENEIWIISEATGISFYSTYTVSQDSMNTNIGLIRGKIVDDNKIIIWGMYDSKLLAEKLDILNEDKSWDGFLKRKKFYINK